MKQEKSLFEQLGSTYHKVNGYFTPNLGLSDEEERMVGIWGQRHLEYLREYHKRTYITLLTNGRLNSYFSDVDKQAQAHLERLIEDMKQAQGIKEQLN